MQLSSPLPPGIPGHQESHGGAVAAFVVGLISLFLLPILGPLAWVLGHQALNEIDAEPWRWSNRGLALAGKICGIVATVLTVVAVVLLVLVIAWVVPRMGGGKGAPDALALLTAVR